MTSRKKNYVALAWYLTHTKHPWQMIYTKIRKKKYYGCLMKFILTVYKPSP